MGWLSLSFASHFLDTRLAKSRDYVPPSEECLQFDFDAQNDIDVIDFGGFQELFTGDCGVTITQHPVDVSVCLGGATDFEVVADGEDLTFQWRHNGINIPGGTQEILVVDPVTPNSAGGYAVTVFSGCAAAGSQVATLIVLDGPMMPTRRERAGGDFWMPTGFICAWSE